MTPGHANSVLILDCMACVDPAKALHPWRQAGGLREWVAEFNGGEIMDPAKAYCPECGAKGRVWRY